MKMIAGFMLAFIISSWFWLDSELIKQQTELILAESSAAHWLGTDSLGRDYFLRLIVASRTTLLIVMSAALISFVAGSWVAYGLTQLKGFKREILSRTVDLVQGLPSFLIIIIIMAALQSQSVNLLIFLMGVLHWPYLARLLEAEIQKIKVQDFIEASRSLGSTNFHLFRMHFFPALRPILSIWFVTHLTAEIVFESSVSFLGFGVQPPDTSLGSLIMEAWPHLATTPRLLIGPAAVVLIMVISLRRDFTFLQTLNLKKSTSPSLTG